MNAAAGRPRAKGAFSVWIEAAWWHPLLWAGLIAGLVWVVVTTELAGYFYRYPVGGTWARWHPNLGGPSIAVGPVRLYVPGAFVAWAWRYEAVRPAVVQAMGAALVGAGAFWAVLSAAFSWPNITGWVFAAPRSSDSKGGARWALDDELKKGGFLHRRPVAGIVLAQSGTAEVEKDPLSRRLVTKRAGALVVSPGLGGDEGHVKVVAETRSGKTSGIVLPTLLTQHEQSVVIWDAKRELWEATALWRFSGKAGEWGKGEGEAKPSVPVRFEPLSETSWRYNPLLEVRPGPAAVGDAMAIARALIPANHPGKDQFWVDAPYDLLASAILHVLYAEEDKSLAGVARFLATPGVPIEETLETMRKTRHVDGKPLEAVASAAAALLNMAEKTRGEVFGTTHAQLSKLVKDPRVAAATSGESEFRPWELQYGRHPMSLYLVPPIDPTARETVLPLMRLVLNQILGRLHDGPPAGVVSDEKPRPSVLLLDEFPTIGPLPAFEGTLSTVGGRGVRAVLVVQNDAQLEHHYGKTGAATISANCATKVVFAASHYGTAELISHEIGSETRQVEHVTHQNKGTLLGAWQAGTRSMHEEGRPLLFPSEVRDLPSSDAIVFLPGMPVYRAKKVRHYDHPEIAPLAEAAAALQRKLGLGGWEERLRKERALVAARGRHGELGWRGRRSAPVAEEVLVGGEGEGTSWVEEAAGIGLGVEELTVLREARRQRESQES